MGVRIGEVGQRGQKTVTKDALRNTHISLPHYKLSGSNSTSSCLNIFQISRLDFSFWNHISNNFIVEQGNREKITKNKDKGRTTFTGNTIPTTSLTLLALNSIAIPPIHSLLSVLPIAILLYYYIIQFSSKEGFVAKRSQSLLIFGP